MPFIMRGVGEVVALSYETATAVDAACGLWANESAAIIERTGKVNSPVDTGQLRRSIMSTPATGGAGTPWVALVYPSVIYGRRIELGFTGFDSLGRYYDQRARPYFEPAIDVNRPSLEALFITRMTEAVGVR